MGDYKAQRESLIETARKLGLSEEAAEDYVDSLLKIPTEKDTKITVSGAEAAAAKIDAVAKDRTASITVELNMEKWNRLPKWKRDAISGNGSVNAGATSAPTSAPAAPSTVFMTPRLYLDSRPIRAALRGDVTTEVASAMSAASAPRRTR